MTVERGDGLRHDMISLAITGPGNASQHTFFEVQEDQLTPPGSLQRDDAPVDAPEKKLTIFAFRLAILEKAASNLGTLAFIWATVVLLGGFAITLERRDFVFVTVILLTEGTRIFSRSHELEWQHQAGSGWTMAGARRSSFRALQCSSRVMRRMAHAVVHPLSIFQGSIDRRGIISHTTKRSEKKDDGPATLRTWRSQDVQILPYTGLLFVSKNISNVLVLLQISSALSSVGLSLTRLIEHDYGEVAKESRNRKMALDLFYALALTTALLFLLEKAYWTWRITHNKLLNEVTKDSGLQGQVTGPDSIRRFFYDAYSKAIDGSVFEGLKMDLVTFAMELLLSESHEEQLMGAQILRSFADNMQFTSETLRKVGESAPVMDRLIGMLNWKSIEEEEIRTCAAHIVLKLAEKKQNAHRIVGVPGAMDAISSLLHIVRSPNLNAHGSSEVSDEDNYEFTVFNSLGLEILEKLAHDHDSCSKIGMTKDLLPKILEFTNCRQLMLTNGQATQAEMKPVSKSLEVVKLLARTTGNTGKKLRRQICEIVFAISNIRLVIKYGRTHMDLQKLGVEILACLAMDDGGKEIIGRTGGIIKLLLAIFLDQQVAGDENSLESEAAEAIAMITMESEGNCDQILKEHGAMKRLMDALSSPTLKMDAARILRNLFAYGNEKFSHRQKEITSAITTVLKDIVETEGKQLEASFGISVQICKLMTFNDFAEALEQIGVEEKNFIRKMVEILHKHKNPDKKVPRMRRFVIDQAIWMMESNSNCIQAFKNLGMKECMEDVAETTTELDNFHVFSGSVGLSRHRIDMSCLVELALNLLH